MGSYINPETLDGMVVEGEGGEVGPKSTDFLD